jgi:metal-sulfur cluster biosynthetic enzyme
MQISHDQIIQALRQVNDPEVGINIVDLGLIYDIKVKNNRVHVTMTLTTPGCPLTTYLVGMTEDAIRASIPNVEKVEIELVWEPRWDPSRMSDAARSELQRRVHKS